MRAVQCANLASALTAFISEVGEQLAAAHPDAGLEELAAEFDANDLAQLDAQYAALPTAPRVQLVVYGLEQFAAAPLNDFLQALFRWAHAPTLRLVVVYTAPIAVLPRTRMPADVHQPTSWLAPVLSPRVLQGMDVAPLAFPDKRAFWKQVVCPFFVRPAAPIVLGRSVLELVRRRFWHIEPSWESVAQVVRLCYLHHATTQPLAAFVDTTPTDKELAAYWTPEVYDALRLALVAPYAAQGESLPVEVRAHVQEASSVRSTLPQARADIAAAAATRIVMLAAVDALLEHTHMADMHGTRLSHTACLAVSLQLRVPYTDWNAARAPAFGHTATTPSARPLYALLAHLAGTVPAHEVPALLARLQASLASCADLDAPTAAGVEASCAALHKLTQRPPDELRAAFLAWLAERWAAMCDLPMSGVGAAIWTYDFAEPIAAALDGAARAGVLLALDAPSEALASMVASSATPAGPRLASAAADWPERAMGVSDVDELRATLAETHDAQVPDVCRLYALYKDSGKFINLADWYDAFVHALEADARARHTVLEASAAHTQVRFALAINELAYLGLLGPTGRKVEHLCRTVWDLPIDGVPESG
ncbi:hypothetical protein CBS9595_001599 [Malassezia furfur]|nr:hypothetical protein CBS9595_001599 [Malassezia furfur]